MRSGKRRQNEILRNEASLTKTQTLNRRAKWRRNERREAPKPNPVFCHFLKEFTAPTLDREPNGPNEVGTHTGRRNPRENQGSQGNKVDPVRKSNPASRRCAASTWKMRRKEGRRPSSDNPRFNQSREENGTIQSKRDQKFPGQNITPSRHPTPRVEGYHSMRALNKKNCIFIKNEFGAPAVGL